MITPTMSISCFAIPTKFSHNDLAQSGAANRKETAREAVVELSGHYSDSLVALLPLCFPLMLTSQLCRMLLSFFENLSVLQVLRMVNTALTAT